MDLYISSLLLGAAGLGAMALGGLGHRGHAGSAHGHGHAVGHGHGHAAGHAHGVQHSAHAHSVGHASGWRAAVSNTMWAITSPRFLFSLVLGFGFAGLLLRPVLGGPLLLAG